MRFLAHPMLGKLARWLRVMGYDCHYQSRYRPTEVASLLAPDRILLTRHIQSYKQYQTRAVFIRSDHVAEQLKELKDAGLLAADPSGWFSRCLACNVLLEKAGPEAAREHVPEYVLHEVREGFHFCPACRRFFWPGTHRQAMVKQLQEWGL